MGHPGQLRFKVVVALATAGLLAVIWAQWPLPHGDRAVTPPAHHDDARLLDELVAAGQGVWDSHPDADVARVLQPRLAGRTDVQDSISSNRFGQREREWAVPKPPGTVRVVLLGDSFIYGLGVPAQDRLGVFLEGYLRERCRAAAGAVAPTIEVLHVGVSSWNIVSECSWVRRQLALLQPDLVIQHVVPNDVGDTAGVRGLGVPGRLVPRHPEQADAVLSMAYPNGSLDAEARSLLPWGMDWESRRRLVEAGEQIERLATTVSAAGARYLLLINWHMQQPVAELYFARRLAAAQVAWLPESFRLDTRYRLSSTDEHWNRSGHEHVARMLYGLITTRGLLPSLDLMAWDEAVADARALDDEGRASGTAPGALSRLQKRHEVETAIDFTALTTLAAGQVHGGADRDGVLAPYASMALWRGEAGTRLHVTGECLARPELDDAHVDVFLDDNKVTTIPLHAGAPIDIVAPLPAAALKQPWLSARFLASDFVYVGDDLRHCVAFRLRRVAIEP